MAFPSNPATGDTYTDDLGTLWTYNGFGWSRTTVAEVNETDYGGPGASIPTDGAPGEVLTRTSTNWEWAPAPGAGGGAVESVNGEVGAVVLTKANLGLANVNNTADTDKPVSTAQQAAIDEAVANARRASILLVNTDPAIYADGAPAVADPGSTGAWYYTNGGGDDKINWYFFGQSPNAADRTTLSELDNMWANVITRSATTRLPFVAVYTRPQGDGNDATFWYRSRLVYELTSSDPNWPGGGIPANTDILIYSGNDPTTVLPNLDHYLLNPVGSQTVGPLNPTEEVLTVSLTTDSSESQGGYAFAVRTVGYENSNDGAVQYNLLTVSESGTTAPFGVKPVVTPVDLPTVDQGVLSLATQGVDSQWPGLAWYFYDYTGTPSAFNRSSSTGSVGVIESVPGTYTMKCRAAWPFGMSDEATINLTVNAFTLNQDNMFGDLSGLLFHGDLSSSSGWSNAWVAIQGAVTYNGGSYTWDNGVINPDTANCIGFWSYTLNHLLAFKYTSDTAGGISSAAGHEWTNINSVPAQGTTIGNSSTTFIADSGQRTAALNATVLGKRTPVAGYYYGGLGATKYLEITPAGSEFATFGANNTNWSYGFVLEDDWVSGAVASQLLAPTGSNYFINTISGYGIGSSPYEYVHYGSSTNGPYDTSTNGATWSVASTNWLIAPAGSLVVVTYDGAGTDTWKLYVDGTLRYSSTNVDTYMSSSVGSGPLRFGDAGGSNASGYPTTYNDFGGWPYRLKNLFITVGTAYSDAQVTELTADKADLTTSDNYASMTTYATFDGSGITSVKGSATYSRGDISFA